MASLAPVSGTPRPADRQNINAATKIKKRRYRRNQSKSALGRRRKYAGMKPRKKRRNNAAMPPAQSVADGTEQAKHDLKEARCLGPKQGRPLSFGEARIFIHALNREIEEEQFGQCQVAPRAC